jgi:hypothetical protein
LLFVPVALEVARRVAAGDALDNVFAFSANEALAESFGIAVDNVCVDATAINSETAEFAALTVASVTALTTYGERLVLVGEVADDCVMSIWDCEAANGGVIAEKLLASQVVAFFADAHTTATKELLCAAVRVATGLSIDDAWELPEVAALIAQTDLLWHDATELGTYFL